MHQWDAFSMETVEQEILHFSAAKFLIMFENEFMDENDMLVSHVWKYDSSHGNLNYCGILCLQVNEMNTWVSVPWVGVGGQVDCFIDLVFIVVRGQLLWWEVVWFGDRFFLGKRRLDTWVSANISPALFRAMLWIWQLSHLGDREARRYILVSKARHVLSHFMLVLPETGFCSKSSAAIHHRRSES